MQEQLKDTSWLHNSFLGTKWSTDDKFKFTRAKGWMKFMDTTLGGNTAINAPYQFTRYADIKERRLIPDIGKGMGRWYSENIDDWGHNVHFRMGVPAYTGIIPFAMRAIDGSTARYLATGRTPGVMSAMGRIGSYIISAAFWEITLLTMFFNILIDFTHTRYYYLKPTMFQYWRTVQVIINTLSAHLGITLPSSMTSRESDLQDPNHVLTVTTNLIEHARETLPETFRKGFGPGSDLGVDVHAVAVRAQALSYQYHKQIAEVTKEWGGMSPKEIAKNLEDFTRGYSVLSKNNVKHLNPNLSNKTLDAYFTNWSQESWYQENAPGEEITGKKIDEILGLDKGNEGKSDKEGLLGWFKNSIESFTGFGKDLHKFIQQEAEDGSQWCSFRITNAVESVSESFSNSSAKSDIANIFNNLSQSVRGAQFNLAGLKTGIGPIDAAVEGIKSFIADPLIDGGTGTFTFLNPIVGLMYGAQIEIPKRWESSSSSLPTTTFNIELRAGYGNVFSYYQDILFPLAMLLAMALPRGAGAQSYGSPFYIQYYNKGRSQVKIGLVSSLSITRGRGNAPWHKNGYPLGVDVSMTIEDMSETVFAPPAQLAMLPGKADLSKAFGNPMEENAMGDYMAVLSAMGMVEQEYMFPKFKRRFDALISNFDTWTSPHKWAALYRDTAIGEMHSLFVRATDVRN